MAWSITWNEKGKRHHTVVFNESDVKRVKQNIKNVFGGTNIRVRKVKEESYADVKRREKAMGIRQ